MNRKVNKSVPFSSLFSVVFLIVAVFYIGNGWPQQSYVSAEGVSPRDDKKFEALWEALHDCKTSVLLDVLKNQLTSEYLQGRGYAPKDTERKGYVSFEVDERLYGFVVRELIVPTTWSITYLTIDAPVDQVKHTFEEKRNIRFQFLVSENLYVRELANSRFQVFADRKTPRQTVVGCETDDE